MATAHTRIRWDRLGRWALLFVLALVLYLYIGPTKNWVSTWREAGEKRQEVAKLRAENERLRVRRDALKRQSSLEREARRLGMVKAGERMYIVEGLPEARSLAWMRCPSTPRLTSGQRACAASRRPPPSSAPCSSA